MTAPIASGGSEFAGWDLHPLESAALPRRTPRAVIPIARRFDEVLAEINRIPPRDLVDCAIKLHCLADPMHGIETGTLAGDLLALRQVAQFLGQVAG
jgi:hypothetical protein